MNFASLLTVALIVLASLGIVPWIAVVLPFSGLGAIALCLGLHAWRNDPMRPIMEARRRKEKEQQNGAQQIDPLADTLTNAAIIVGALALAIVAVNVAAGR